MKTKRYYVYWSSVFDNPPYYEIDKIFEAIKNAGGKYIRKCNQFGWSNQPKVVAFRADGYESLKAINNSVQDAIGTEWIIISEQNW